MFCVFFEFIFYYFSLIYKKCLSLKFFCFKVNFVGKKFKFVSYGFLLWGGVGVSLFFLNLLYFVLINIFVVVNFVYIKLFSK